jgi:hypothetical protein
MIAFIMRDPAKYPREEDLRRYSLVRSRSRPSKYFFAQGVATTH